MIKKTFIIGTLAFTASLWSQSERDLAAEEGLASLVATAKEAPQVFPFLAGGASINESFPLSKGQASNDQEYMYLTKNNAGVAALVHVQKEKGEWIFKEIGYQQIAKELILVQEAWPQANGYTIELIEDPDTHMFSFVIPQAGFKNQTLLTFDAPASNEEKKYTTLTAVED